METNRNIDIYIAANVDEYGPYKGRGAYAAILTWGPYRKTICCPVARTSGYEALKYATLAALAYLRGDRLEITVHTLDQAFALNYRNSIDNNDNVDIPGSDFNVGTLTGLLMERCATMTFTWDDGMHGPDLALAAEMAHRCKRQRWYPEMKKAV